MNQTIPFAESEAGVARPVADTISAKTATLRDSVRATVKEYFVKLDGTEPANVYELFLAEVELPLLEVVLQFTRENQSETARMLKLSRGTLRKKMQLYGLLKSKKRK